MTTLDTTSPASSAAPADQAAALLTELRTLADAFRKRQEAAWERARIERLQRERHAVARAAAGHTAHYFQATLAKVLTAGHWQGYPSLHPYYDAGTQAEPCAVAHLGEGLFLHYTARSSSYHRGEGHDHRMLLLAPCPCGNYLQIPLGGHDYTLAVELTNAQQRTDCYRACTPSGHHADDEKRPHRPRRPRRLGRRRRRGSLMPGPTTAALTATGKEPRA